MDVHLLLQHQEDRLRQVLDGARGSLTHAASKGAVLERAVRGWLRTVLPQRLWVGHGEVVDSTGAVSRQHDVIIAFDEHPRFFDDESPQAFFVEGVAAVIEVKASLRVPDRKAVVIGRSLSGGQREDVLNAAAQLRVLRHRGSIEGWRFRDDPEVAFAFDAPHMCSYSASPPLALLGFESENRMCDITERLALQPRLVDAVFALREPGGEDPDQGGWAVLQREGAFRPRPTVGGKPIPGWHHHHDDLVLVRLLSWLESVINYWQVSTTEILMPYLQRGLGGHLADTREAPLTRPGAATLSPDLWSDA